MSQSSLLIDSASSATIGDNAVIPVLTGAVTGTGTAIAAQTTLATLKNYFEGGIANEIIFTTAIATPTAFTATTFSAFASTVSGATVMGFGTTGDVTLKNRSGTDVFVVTSNSLNATLAGALAMTGALSGVTQATFSTKLVSSTALATPSALVATGFNAFASTVSGASIMGFGTTNDVTLMNQAGTPVLGIVANTTGVTFAGSLVQSVAQIASVGTTPGTPGTDTTWLPGQGGNTTIVTTGVGGKGAGWTITTGAGGTAALAATAGTGGAGGDYTLTTGAGAASAVTGAGTGTGGKGGAYALLSGVGGATSVSTGVNLGGASGAITVTTAAGGASTNGSTNTGGASGVLTLATGNGGAGATAQGASGAITLQTGSSTAAVGTIVFKPGTLQVLSVNWVSALVGQVVIDGTYGAGVASLRLNGLTTAATNNLVGTLTNSPVTGNPTFWAPVSIAGSIKYVPCF